MNIGAYKEVKINERAALARQILSIINDDTLPEFVALDQIEKIANKAIKKEEKFWEKYWSRMK